MLDKLDLVNPRNVQWKRIKFIKAFEPIARRVRTFNSIPKAIESDLAIATTVRPREVEIPFIKVKDLSKVESKNIVLSWPRE